jgi:hypothetical protein
LAPKPGKEILHLDLMPHGRLLDDYPDSCETLTDFSYPVVLLQSGECGCDCFIESFRGDLDRVLDISNIRH